MFIFVDVVFFFLKACLVSYRTEPDEGGGGGRGTYYKHD